MALGRRGSSDSSKGRLQRPVGQALGRSPARCVRGAPKACRERDKWGAGATSLWKPAELVPCRLDLVVRPSYHFLIFDCLHFFKKIPVTIINQTNAPIAQLIRSFRKYCSTVLSFIAHCGFLNNHWNISGPLEKLPENSFEPFGTQNIPRGEPSASHWSWYFEYSVLRIRS